MATWTMALVVLIASLLLVAFGLAAIVAVIVLALGWMGLLGGGSFMALDRMRMGNWNATWKGHKVELRHFITHDELWIDEVEVARGPSGGWLAGELEHAGSRIPVKTLLRGGDEKHGHLFVDGHQIGGDPLPDGFILPDDLARPDTEGPDDPRWTAVRSLLDGMADLAPDDERVKVAASELETRIRERLQLLAHLTAASEAHGTLGGDTDALSQIRAEHDDAIEVLFGQLRELHLTLSAQVATDAPSTGVGELLDRFEAEAEVEDAGAERRDALERARKAASAKTRDRS